VSPRVRELLSAASVIGREFELSVLERVTGLTRGETIAAIQSALDRRIVTSTAPTLERYRFSHALFRQVLYDELVVSRRAELHFRTGEVLEALSPGNEVPAAQLAHHFRIAAEGNASAKAAAYALQAGYRALRSFAFTEAARHFDASLEALRRGDVQEPLLIETLTSLGQAYRLAGDYARASTAFVRAADIARRRGDAAAVAGAALGFAQVNPETGKVNAEALRLLEEAIPLLESRQGPVEPSVDALLSMVLSRLSTCSAFAGRTVDAELQSRRSLEIARRLGDPQALARALEARHWVLWRPGTAGERLAISAEMLDLATASLDASLMTEARVGEITDLLELGRRDAFDRAISQYERSARESRDSNALYNVRVFETTRAILEGRFAAAERIAEEALPIGSRIFQDAARNFYSAAILWIRLEQGRAHEIIDVYKYYFESEPPSALLRSTILRLAAEIGDHAATRSELEAICPSGKLELREDWAFLATAAHVAVACALLGEAALGRTLAERLVPFSGSHAVLGPAIVYLGPVDFYVGLCHAASGELDLAALALERAGDQSDRVGARAVTTRVQYHLADVLAQRGGHADRELALEKCNLALETSRELEMAALARRAEVLRTALIERG
jgi:predicted ATPase